MNEDDIIINCPHCKILILVKKKELNCKIFRCGIFKKNYNQIPPHLSEELCERLLKEEKIFGCGKPFKVENEGNDYIAVICDYI